ncbi:hypothetical protein [Sphingomonas bacterium]|uniref:hypothetical protein n=1 Tax=Sphingomonas bacterium TaxID=1895847 RepID=UPI001575865A|nr:hypothetical protein [Sphingomonas bacterium]
MTRDQLRLLDAVKTTASVADRLRDSLRFDGAELKAAIALLPQGDAGALRETDAFIQRYQQLVEHMTHRLFGAIYRAEELGERPPPLRRLLALLEGTKALKSAETWTVYIEIRNRLVHEYPSDESELATALTEASAAGFAILDELEGVMDYVTRRKLLESVDAG